MFVIWTILKVWLTLSWRRPLSYRSQSFNLLGKSVDWFLYDNGSRHERVNKLTCYKNHENPTCIDLILTNRPGYFQQSNVLRLDFLIFIDELPYNLKWVFKKKLAKIIAYRDYKKFDKTNLTISPLIKFDVSNSKETIFNIFDKHAPIKQKYRRVNEAHYMKKELHREIMKWSRLLKNFWGLNLKRID